MDQPLSTTARRAAAVLWIELSPPVSATGVWRCAARDRGAADYRQTGVFFPVETTMFFSRRE
jgi:hypothetical protein